MPVSRYFWDRSIWHLGERYSKDILRKDAQYGLVELTFLPEERELTKLAALDIYPEEGAVVLTRRLMDGRSTCRINGETVNDVTSETGGRDFD